MTGLERSVERGLRWTTFRKVITALIDVASGVILARLLTKTDYGIVAIALLAYNGVINITRSATRDAVIHYQQNEETYVSTAFWLNTAVSAVAGVFMLLISDWVGQFYNSPLVTPLSRVIVLVFIFDTLALVPLALLMKRFQFVVHETFQVINLLINTLGGITMAYLGYGAWSLVIPRMVGSLFLVVASWWAAGFLPSRKLEHKVLIEVFSFGRNLSLSSFLNYVMNYLDEAIIGRVLGTDSLGLYNFAKSKPQWVLKNVVTLVSDVAFPTLARDQSAMDKLKRTYLDMLHLTTTMTTPALTGLFIIADLFLPVVYGQKWADAVPVFRAFTGFMLMRALSQLSGPVTSAIGRTDIAFKLNLIKLPIIVLALWLGLQNGIIGASAAMGLVLALASLAYMIIVMRLLKVNFHEGIATLGPSFLSSVVMGIGVISARRLAAQRFESAVIQMIISVAVGGVAYIATLFLLDRKGFYHTMKSFIQVVVPASIRRRVLKWLARYNENNHPTNQA